jgi:hypothetical protein
MRCISNLIAFGDYDAFYDEFIKDTYKNHLIIMDNAKFHKSKIVKDNIEKSKNKIIYILLNKYICIAYIFMKIRLLRSHIHITQN